MQKFKKYMRKVLANTNTRLFEAEGFIDEDGKPVLRIVVRESDGRVQDIMEINAEQLTKAKINQITKLLFESLNYYLKDNTYE